MSKDYYKILGVDKSATQDEIKKAFRKLAHQYHPDKGGGNEEKFKEINEAYQVLGNNEKRKQYDQFGAAFNNGANGFNGGGFNWQDFARQAGAQGGFRTGAGFNFDDFDLGDIFGDWFGSGRRGSNARRVQRGADLEYRMQISLEDSVFGAEKIIQLDKMDRCDKCEGRGYDKTAKIITCPQCKGSGRISQQQRTFLGVFQTEVICPTCGGEGTKPEKFCSQCHGSGRVKIRKQLKIKIPAGINNGESIKLSGQGEAGEKGASAGDLYITFEIKPKAGFKRDGYNILTKQKINFVQAALGDKIEVKTLDGLVKLKIPAGTQSGDVFNLIGKGAYKLHGRGRGDQLVEIIVETPKKLSRRAKKILEELKEEL